MRCFNTCILGLWIFLLQPEECPTGRNLQVVGFGVFRAILFLIVILTLILIDFDFLFTFVSYNAAVRFLFSSYFYMSAAFVLKDFISYFIPHLICKPIMRFVFDYKQSYCDSKYILHLGLIGLSQQLVNLI